MLESKYFWITGGVFIVFLTLESITSWMFIRGSKKNYPELWDHAGQPTIWGNADLVMAWPLIEYVKNRKYQGISDQNAIGFAERLRSSMLIGYFGAILSMVVFIAVTIFGNWM